MISLSLTSNALEALLRLFYPASCGLCVCSLELDERLLCGACKSRLDEMKFPYEDRLAERTAGPLDQTWALFPYENAVKEVLTQIKFSRKRWLLGLFREAIGETAQSLAAEIHYDAVVPIPMDRLKGLQREFNPPHILAQWISKAAGIPCHAGWLLKPHATIPQSRLNREERLANLRGVFKAKRTPHLKGKKILLVDDILTTGATAEEAARTLREGGTLKPDLLTLARTK